LIQSTSRIGAGAGRQLNQPAATARFAPTDQDIEWSGAANPAWQAFTTPITAGTHTLRWSYEKDASASVGADAAWIDALSLPAVAP